MRLYMILFVFCAMFMLTACAPDPEPLVPLTPEQAWINQVNSVVVPYSYHANYYSTFSGSSGSRLWDIAYDVVNETVVSCTGGFMFSGRETYTRSCNVSEDFVLMSEIKSNLTILEMGIFQRYDKMYCYYNISNPSNSPMILFVCFNQGHNIVAYGGKGGYGGIQTFWHLDGYLPDSEWYSYTLI
ncbi:MAG: hypothetical protein ACP5OA_06820 [Candidatus Woesearchaeota archaeon]